MKNNKVISKKLLEEFLQKRQLTGIVSFLQFIKHKKNLRDFYRYLYKHKYLSPSLLSTNSIFFHGTQSIKNILMPRNSMGRFGKLERNAYVYATDDPNYAIFLAILKLKNGSASARVTMKKTMLIVGLDFVNGSSKLKNGYVHILSTSGFKKTRNREYITNHSVEPLFIIAVTPTDLTVPIYIQIKS